MLPLALTTESALDESIVVIRFFVDVAYARLLVPVNIDLNLSSLLKLFSVIKVLILLLYSLLATVASDLLLDTDVFVL